MPFLDTAGITAQVGYIKGYVADQVAALTAVINTKAAATHTHTKSELGLGNVENTADSVKNVATAASAMTAAKATGDADGNPIKTTYVKVADIAAYTAAEVETVWNTQTAED